MVWRRVPPSRIAVTFMFAGVAAAGILLLSVCPLLEMVVLCTNGKGRPPRRVAPARRARSLERVEQQPRQELGEEVRGLRGHVLAGCGDVANLLYGRWPHEERGIVLARGNAREGLVGVARVEQTVEVR